MSEIINRPDATREEELIKTVGKRPQVTIYEQSPLPGSLALILIKKAKPFTAVQYGRIFGEQLYLKRYCGYPC